jgi:2-methylaconitate cis-trans-isomerase PrpF
VKKIPFTYIQGGTSRAVFFLKKNLPKDETLRNNIFRAVLGLPASMKTPVGVLGKQLPTNKIAIIAPSEHPGFSVDYHFFQMNDHTGIADDRGTCGNMSSAVGPFAADHGLVPVKEGENTLNVYNVNTGKLFRSTFFVKNGKSQVAGNVLLPGLTEAGSPISLDFISPGGGYSGKLFPSGNKKDTINCKSYGKIEATLIDCVNPIVIVSALDVGMTGKELRNEEIGKESIKILQRIRGEAAVMLGLVDCWEEAAITSTYIPHIAVVAKAMDYLSSNGEKINAADMDFCARAVFTNLHPSYPAGAAIATAAAACIPGTLIHEIQSPCRKSALPVLQKVSIGHPGGCISVLIAINGEEIENGILVRTARHLFEGELYVGQM